jgi:2-oxoglutarate ferredoxin oxidoreductase subunit alpha
LTPSLGITIAGEAGQGVQLVSDLAGRLLARSGRRVFTCQDVMSRIRGGHNFARLRTGDEPVSAPADSDELQVCLRPAFAKMHLPRLSAGGLSICEEGEAVAPDRRVVTVPISRTAVEAGGGARMANSVALGLIAAAFELPVEGFAELLRERFGPSDGQTAQRNVDCLEAGLALGRESGIAGRLSLPAAAQAGRLVLVSGSQALALGAIAGNVRVVAGYPMSPGTPVLEYCSRHAQEAGLVVEYVEDEVAAINLALGASFAGARAMVATSGGGFALMNEGLSLAGMTETPVVVMLGMRPGPATGMATRTAQAELFSAIYAGHGEFPRVVLAPGDARAAYDFALRATDLADRFQVPAIVLFDQFLGDGAWTVDGLPPAVDAGRGADGAGGPEPYAYRRYAPGPDGVSARIRPGTRDQLVYVDSDEHGEEGHITESAEVRTAMVHKRAAKLAALLREAPKPEAWPEPARLLACCFGSTKGTVAEAVTRLRARGVDVAMVHFDWLWPFPGEPVQRLCEGRHVVTVENNYGGQLAQLLAQEALVECRGTVRRYDGRPFSVAEVVEGIERLAGERP